MNKQRRYAMLAGLMLMAGCTQAQDAPTQVIYRFDDHRYLELKGWNCEGALYYVDPVRGIRSEVASQFTGHLLTSMCTPPSATLPFLGGKPMPSSFQKTTVRHGKLRHLTPVFIRSNRMAQTVHPEKICSRSRSLTIRVFS